MKASDLNGKDCQQYFNDQDRGQYFNDQDRGQYFNDQDRGQYLFSSCLQGNYILVVLLGAVVGGSLH